MNNQKNVSCIDETILEYLILQEEQKKLKKKIDDLKKMLMPLCNKSGYYDTQNFILSIETTEKTNLDTKQLYIDFPDIKATYGKKVISHSLNVISKAVEKTA